MSLSFYTCHSKNILGTYDLSNKFQNNLSYYPKRYINFVKPNEILEDGETPLMGFSSYLTRLDKELYLGMKENILSMTFASKIQESNPQKTCEIEITTSIPQTGSLSLILNKKFIGNINSLDNKTSFAFNCEFLKDKNVLTLQNNSVTEKLQVETLPSEIMIIGLQTEIMKWKNYFDDQNNFEGSKIEFIF
jgi:hypothetical protein